MITHIKRTVGVLVAACLVVSGLAPSVSAAGGPNLMVFSSYKDGKSEVYAARRDGTQLRQLTFNSVIEKEVSASPDGRQLAFSVAPDTEADSGIAVLNLANNQQRTIVPAEAGFDFRDPVWSPDGHQIAFTSIGYNNEFCVKVYNLVAHSVQKITCGDRYMGVNDWSPDGRKIMFSMFRRGLYAIDATVNAQPAFITNGDAGAYSPKGDKMVYSRYDEASGFYQLYVANVDGSMPRQITFGQAVHYPVDWAEDGYLTVTKFDFSGPIQTFSMLPDGTGQILLPAASGAINGPGKGLVQ